VFHCQGTDELITPILFDDSVEILTCWKQADDFVSEFGREYKNVGISISKTFFYSGELKQPSTFAFMPRRGSLPRSEELFRFEMREIQKMNESQVSEVLKKASGFLALSENEWFGLPALEAMAAGCLVVSPKTIGGGEYLKDGKNCFVESLENLGQRMAEVLGDEAQFDLIRQEAIKTSYEYHPRAQFQHLQQLIAGGSLRFLA
jgi:glycosyltransferase involved in cell wall biosynthesis